MKGDEVTRHDTETALYQQQLEQYVYTYLEQKYSIENIISHLISQGHEEAQVKKALHAVNAKYYNNTLEITSSSSPTKKLLVVGCLVVILCLGAFFFFSSPSYEFFITLETTRIGPGEPLAFQVVTTAETELTSLVETSSGEFVIEQNHVVSSPEQVFISLPQNLATGFYTVVVTQSRGTQDTPHQFSFQVSSQRVPASQQDLGALSSAILERDILYCEGIVARNLQDECYFSVSLELRDENLCDSIALPQERDRCYFSHILNGRALSCSVIRDLEIRDACENI